MNAATLEDAPMTTDERYVSAINTSNLRDEADRLGVPADLLKAAALSRSVVGIALKRLHGEWDGCSLAKKLDADGINRLAIDLAKHRTEAQRADEYAKLRSKGVGHSEAAKASMVPIKNALVAKVTAEAMHLHEMALIFQRLKSLSAVRLMVAKQAESWKIAAPLDIATAVTFWWLHKRCDECGGTKLERNKEGKPTGRSCRKCKGTGEKTIPCGEAGRRIANYLDDCMNRGGSSIKMRLRGRE